MSKVNTENIYEIIRVPAETGVRFFTSVDPGSYIPWHWHRAVEIICMLEGELTVSIESTTFQITAGQCVLINSDVIHATKCTAFNKAIVLQLPLEFIELYIPQVQQLVFTLDLYNDTPVYQTKLQMFRNTLSQMQVADEIRPDGYLLRFNSLLFELLFQMYHNFSAKVFSARLNQRNKNLTRLNPVLKYIGQHYNEPIRLQEIAEIAYLQPGYFCRFFKDCMGITFLEYQNEVRISYIYRDLISTQETVYQILERHGFSNYKLFRRMFYEHFNNTPSGVRGVRQVSDSPPSSCGRNP